MALSKSDVMKVKLMLQNSTMTQKQIADRFSVSRSLISDIATNRRHSDVPWPIADEVSEVKITAKDIAKASKRLMPGVGKKKSGPNRVLAVGDVHAPITHPGYESFIIDIAEKYDCNRFVFIGDMVDWHGISFHTRHPSAPSAGDEYFLAASCIQRWYRLFPEAVVTIGNHDERVIRLAESVSIPSMLLRDYSDVWKTPNWNWQYEHTIDDVYYFHGTGQGGMHPAYNVAKQQSMSCVMGHVHSAGGIKWLVSPRKRWFGMDVGCGIDDRAAAMAYARHTKRRSVLSCGVVIDGVPYHEIMRADPGEKYHRSRF